MRQYNLQQRRRSERAEENTHKGFKPDINKDKIFQSIKPLFRPTKADYFQSIDNFNPGREDA